MQPSASGNATIRCIRVVQQASTTGVPEVKQRATRSKQQSGAAGMELKDEQLATEL